MNLRSPTEDDLAEIAELFNAASREFYGLDAASEQLLRTWLTSPTTDVERNLRLALADGTIAGYVDVDPRDSHPTRCWVEIAIRRTADFDAAAATLLEWAEGRSGEEPEPVLRTSVWQRDEQMRRALSEHGYSLIRHSYTMEIDLGDTIATPAWPEGIRVRTIRDGEARPVWEVHEETFADTWEYPGVSFEEWKHWMIDGPMFAPDLWFLALAGDEIAGICLCRVSDREPDLGWVQMLGVRRTWRRRGLGRALLQHAFSEFGARGFGRVGLGVDAESLTGADRLYETAGMRVVRRRDVYEKLL